MNAKVGFSGRRLMVRGHGPDAGSHKPTATFLLVCVAALVCVPGWAEEAPKADLAALVNSMPQADGGGKDGRFTAPDRATMEKVFDEVLKGGKEGVAALVKMLVEPGKGEDYKARYVLHALVTNVNRPEGEPNRALVREALLSTLGGETPKAVQKCVLEELKHIGDAGTAKQIGKFLADEDLYEHAALDLLAIGGTADIFREALPAAKGRCRVTIIQALGSLRDTKAADELRKAVSDADRDTRLAACDALANIGDASAADALLAAGEAAKDYERTHITEAALRLAERLCEADRKKDAEKIYQKLWDARAAPEERNVRIAALQGLVATRGELSDILTAMRTNDPQIRSVAIRAAITLLGEGGTQKVVDSLQKATPAERAALLAILGARKDPAALPAVLPLLKDPDEQVRIAALQAASAIGGEEAAKAVVDRVSAATGKERDEVLDALTKMRGPEANKAVGAAATQATDAGIRSGLIGVLAARRAEDQVEAVASALAEKDLALRVAALKALAVIGNEGQVPQIVKIAKETTEKDELSAAEGALVAMGPRRPDACANAAIPALEGAPPANAAVLLRALGAASTRKALETVVAQTKNANAEIKDAAVRALTEWRERDAAAPLLEIAQTSDQEAHQVLALRAVIRLVEEKINDASQKLKLLDAVLKAAKRTDEKRKALAALGNVKTADALQAAVACLGDETIKDEAAAAVVQIASEVAKRNADAARDALEKTLQVVKKDSVRREANDILRKIKKP